MDLTQPQLLVEIILSILLCAGILYSFYITRVLSSLKRDKETLGNLLNSLQESINTAETGMEQLRITSEISGRPLNRLIEKGKEMQEGLNASLLRASKIDNKVQTSLEKTTVQLREISKLIQQTREKEGEITDSLNKQKSVMAQRETLQRQQAQEEKIRDQQLQLRKQEQQRLQKLQQAQQNVEEDKVNLQEPRHTPRKAPPKNTNNREKSLFTDTVSLPSSERLTRARPYLRALNKKG